MEVREFEQIIRTLRARLISVARYYLSDEDEAEDVVQEASVKLWLLRERLEKADFQKVGMTVVRNLSIDRLRRQKAHPQESLDAYGRPDGSNACDRPHEQADAQSRMEEKEDDAWLTTALRQLPDKYRVVLRMRQVEQLETTEIASLMGTSESNVRMMLSRARKMMMEQLKQRRY